MSDTVTLPVYDMPVDPIDIDSVCPPERPYPFLGQCHAIPNGGFGVYTHPMPLETGGIKTPTRGHWPYHYMTPVNSVPLPITQPIPVTVTPVEHFKALVKANPGISLLAAAVIGYLIFKD